MISRAVAATTSTRNPESIKAAATQPISAESVTATRPAAQAITRMSNDQPCSGRRPVQLGIAVSRKPVTTAGT
jgi:hypothetical protein